MKYVDDQKKTALRALFREHGHTLVFTKKPYRAKRNKA